MAYDPTLRDGMEDRGLESESEMEYHDPSSGGMAMGVRRLLVAVPDGNPLDDPLMTRLSTAFVDITTTSAIAAVSLTVLGRWLVPILLLTLIRIGWWFCADKKPEPPKGDPTWQSFSAKAVHLCFYIVILGMVASGIGMVILSGAGSVLFGGSETELPNFREFLPRVPHGLGARAMLVLLILHVGAALYHHFIKKDGLIWRMWFGS